MDVKIGSCYSSFSSISTNITAMPISSTTNPQTATASVIASTFNRCSQFSYWSLISGWAAT
jgi:hypothetical protein